MSLPEADTIHSTWQGIDVERVIGEFRASEEPVVVVIAGMHGNEPAGVIAVRRVLDRLRVGDVRFHGRVVALAGNREALRQRVRFVDRDLNRMWGDSASAAQPADARPVPAEENEQAALTSAIGNALGSAAALSGTRPWVFDLHTTSSISAPFALFTDRLVNRSIAMSLGIPLVLGLEEELSGTVLDHFDSLGVAAVTVEGGQHDDPVSAHNLEAVLWQGLDAAGCLPAGPPGGRKKWRGRLAERTRGLPRLFDVRHRHVIQPEEGFKMDPKHPNFEVVREGQRLASDRNGVVGAPADGLLFMPLYQPQGEDGFFIVRPILRMWLPISSFLRRLHLGRLLPWLPGVRHDPTRPGSIVLNTAVARLVPLQLLHLLGFRKIAWEGTQLVAVRRPHDFARPA